MNGHTYTPDLDTRINNLAQQLTGAELLAAAAMSEGNPHDMERILTGMALDPMPELTAETMKARLDEIQFELCAGNISHATANTLAEEAAEIIVYLDREGMLIDDFADYRLAEKHGVGL